LGDQKHECFQVFYSLLEKEETCRHDYDSMKNVREMLGKLIRSVYFQLERLKSFHEEAAFMLTLKDGLDMRNLCMVQEGHAG
jgi:hypothetical protein